MAHSLQKFREVTFQLLYRKGFETDQNDLSLIMREQAIPKSVAKQAEEKAQSIWMLQKELEAILQQKAVGYSLKRISRIEKTIILLGLYELLYTDLPEKVAISEAIRLTKKFSTPEGATFVNAILDSVYKDKHEAI